MAATTITTIAMILEIITPEGIVLAESVESITFPTADGTLTVLPGHEPILGATVPGKLTYKNKTGEAAYTLDSGFFMLRGDKLSILLEAAATTA